MKEGKVRMIRGPKLDLINIRRVEGRELLRNKFIN